MKPSAGPPAGGFVCRFFAKNLPNRLTFMLQTRYKRVIPENVVGERSSLNEKQASAPVLPMRGKTYQDKMAPPLCEGQKTKDTK